LSRPADKARDARLSRPILDGSAMTHTLRPGQLREWLFDGREIALFDVREHGQYGAAHLLFAVNLPYSRLELDVRRLAPNPAVRLVVYDEDGVSLAPRAVARLQALGYTEVWTLAGGAQAWQADGNRLFAGVHVLSKAFGEWIEQHRHTPYVTPSQLWRWQREGRDLVVLDGRPFSEFMNMSIPGAVCCPNGELALRLEALIPDAHTPIVINCAGRTRSIIGAQTLRDLGIANPVYALQNGTQGWFLADQPLDHGSELHYPPANGRVATQLQLGRAQQLGERAGVRWVDAEQVRRWAADPMRSLFVGDVRSAEEFAAGSLTGAQHTPGGQLIQATDHYIGVRHARVVLFDDDGVRAPVVAAWLRQMGHQAYVLEQGAASELALPAPEPLKVNLPLATGSSLGTADLIDLRPSQSYRRGHVQGAQWSIRPLLAAQVGQSSRPLVLISDDPHVAQLAAQELPPAQRDRVRLLPAAQALALPQVVSTGSPADSQCIDFLFFVHDRHAGNKDAARQYLAWEMTLLGQMTEQEISTFVPLAHTSNAG